MQILFQDRHTGAELPTSRRLNEGDPFESTRLNRAPGLVRFHGGRSDGTDRDDGRERLPVPTDMCNPFAELCGCAGPVGTVGVPSGRPTSVALLMTEVILRRWSHA
jgi:hypothetical protein